MLLIYPVVGVHAFEVSSAAVAGEPHLYLHGPSATVEGKETPDGFVVLAGSTARADAVPSIHTFLNELRQSLIHEGAMQPTTEGLRFVRDYLFKSSSTAAAVVLGRNANGRTEWKDENGKTLKQIPSDAITPT
jgi:Domain of unknown function (DUF4357)